MFCKKINLQGQTWKLCLDETAQLSFTYKVPNSEVEWLQDPLWKDFDYGEPEYEEWSFNYEGIKTDVFPLVYFNRLMEAIIMFVNQSRTTFFWFKPTSGQRGRIYHKLAKKLSSRLKGEWHMQIYEEKWFYFTKLNLN